MVNLRRHYPNRGAFDAALAAWYASASTGQWVEPGVYARKPSVRVDHRGVTFELKAETSREAIGRYLEALRRHPDSQWTVVANARGRFNKLALGDPPRIIEGLWIYVKPGQEDIAEAVFR